LKTNRLTDYLKNIIKTSFVLADVGARGGIMPLFEAFLPNLEATGFDCDPLEVERLNAAAPDGSSYQSYLVTGSDGSMDEAKNSVSDRISYTYVSRLRGVQKRYSSCTESKISLDSYFSERKKPDFIKTDTDGNDLNVLTGAEKILSAGSVLGLQIECFFSHIENNLLRDVDSLLAGYGYKLYDLSVNRYSRSSLPSKFLNGNYMETQTGQIVWGDALYFRDIDDMGGYSSEMLLKQISLFELYNLNDCAVEFLDKYADKLKTIIDIDYSRDLLAGDMGYKGYMDRFHKETEDYFKGELADDALFYVKLKESPKMEEYEFPVYVENAAIFGTGKAGEIAAEICRLKGKNIVCFIDDFASGELQNIKITDWAGFVKKYQSRVDTILMGTSQKGSVAGRAGRFVKIHSLPVFREQEDE
jgi:hypothetical protein